MTSIYVNHMIKEVFRKNFPSDTKIHFTYNSSKYLDVETKSGEETNLIFEFKVKNFDKPFVGNVIKDFFKDYDDYTRFFAYVNQNNYESAFMAIGFQSIDIYKIWDLFVDPAFQNLGIGTELVRYAEKIAKEWSAKAIVVECRSSNYPAINFFQKNKFLITGFNLVQISRDDFKRHNFVVTMSKLL